MAFFQNKSTLITPLDTTSLVLDGIDSLFDTRIFNWDDFINVSEPRHEERRKAFQEFIFMMFYYQNYQISGQKFPHNKLYNKVLRFFIETNYFRVPSTTSYVWIPKNAAGLDIFEVDNAALKASRLSPADELPALRTNRDQIKREVDAAIFAGDTSIGFFQEVSTLFGYFYHIRQLILLTGHKWIYNDDISMSSTIARPIERYTTEDVYGSAPSSRTQEMMKALFIDIDPVPSSPPLKRPRLEDELPYLYNSLLKKLTETTPPATPVAAADPIYKILIPSDILTDEHQVRMAYFLKVIDPWRALGVRNTTAVSSDSRVNTSIGRDVKHITAKPLPPTGVTLTNTRPDNTFIEDLFVTIRSGNTTLTTPGTGDIPLAERFYLKTLPAGGFTDAWGLKQVKGFYDNFKTVIRQAIDLESQCMLNVLLLDRTTQAHPTDNLLNLAKSTVLGSGVGEVTTSLLGIVNFGLPLFNYDIDNNAEAKSTQVSPKMDVDFSRNQVAHLGGFGLNINPSADSKLNITVDSDIYKFALSPDNSLTTDLKSDSRVDPLALSGNFFHENDLTDPNICRYFKMLTPKGVAAGTAPDKVLLAEYFRDRRDLVFRTLTDAELKAYNLKSIKSVTYEITSASVASGTYRSYEEFLAFVSIFEDESPQPGLLTDDVNFASETFQLYGTNLPKINKDSYKRILSTEKSKKTIYAFFDILKEDILSSTPAVNMNTDTPKLLGSYIGKLNTSNPFPRVIRNTTYKFKFHGGTSEKNPDVDELETYNLLKYSWATLAIMPVITPPTASTATVPAPPGLPTISYTVSLNIKSHVSPSISSLEDKYLTNEFPKTGSGSTDAAGRKARFRMLRNPTGTPLDHNNIASNNQVLAMLRSFGLLEAIVQRLLELLAGYTATVDEKTYIAGRIKSWLPDPGTTGAADLKCYDEPLTPTSTAEHLALPVSLEDYYYLKTY